MTLRWHEAIGDVRRRLNRRTVIAGATAGCGAAIAIGAMELFSVSMHYPLAVIPFATSIVLVIGSPRLIAIARRSWLSAIGPPPENGM